MPTVIVLTPTEVSADYGLTVSQVDLNDAANQILALTAYTLAEHVDLRDVDAGSVRRAWAIVASRLRNNTEGDEALSVIGETEGNYTYNESVTLKGASQINLLSGAPNELLGYTARFTSYATDTRNRGGLRTVDEFGVVVTNTTRVF